MAEGTEVKELKLDAISFRGAPTESQMANALHDVQVFFNKAVGAMMHEGIVNVKSPKVIATFNATGHIMNAEDTWKGESGLVVPQSNAPQVIR